MIIHLPQPSAEQIGKAISALLPSDLVYIPHLASAGLMGAVAKRGYHNGVEYQRPTDNLHFKPASKILWDLVAFQASAEVSR